MSARAIALDLGSSALKRLVRTAAGTRPIPDLARGSLRIPAGLLPERELVRAAQSALADAARLVGDESGAAFAAAVPASSPDAEREALRAAALAAGFEAAEVIAAPVAIALDLARSGDPADREAWVVVDAGHAALRAHLVRWHHVSGRAVPRLERTLLEVAELGGLALDRALARSAWAHAPVGAAAPALPQADDLSARGFFEVKELAEHVRGPVGRRVALEAGTAFVEVPQGPTRVALAEARERAGRLAPELAKVVAETGAARVVVAGGLVALGPLRAALGSAVVAEAPLWAAARGALRALDASPVARAEAPIALVARTANGATAVPLVPRGALLPGRFGPVTLEVALQQEPLEVPFVEGDRIDESAPVLVAPLPRRAPRSTLSLELEWSYEHGWRACPKDGNAVPLAKAPPQRASVVREALGFDFAAHQEAVPADFVFVFVATKGEGPLLARSVEAIATLAKRAAERAPGARFGAIAVGDHPQGGVKPRYVTLVHPPGELAALEKFVSDQARDPVEGVDAPEAIECALLRAAEVPWRADAEKFVYVLTDVPPHEKTEPPFCQVDWRESLKKLRQIGAVTVPVLLEGGVLAPDVARRTRAFLDALRGEGEPVIGLRGKASEPLLATVDRALGKQRLDAKARELLARLPVGTA